MGVAGPNSRIRCWVTAYSAGATAGVWPAAIRRTDSPASTPNLPIVAGFMRDLRVRAAGRPTTPSFIVFPVPPT